MLKSGGGIRRRQRRGIFCTVHSKDERHIGMLLLEITYIKGR